MANHEKIAPTSKYRENLTRLPHLADFMIHTNIQQAIRRLKEAPAWSQPGGRSSETLVKYSDFRVVLVAMKAGIKLADHHADGPISVQVIQGRVGINLANGETVDLRDGDIVALERALKHEVVALEESVFLLTIAWSKPEEGVTRD